MSGNRFANATVLPEEIENRLKQIRRIDLEHLVKVAEPITREHCIKKEVWIAFSDSVNRSEFVRLINSSKIKTSDEWINVNKIEMSVQLDPASEIGIHKKKQDLVYPRIRIPSETVYMPIGLAKNLSIKPESPELVIIAQNPLYVNMGDLEYI